MDVGEEDLEWLGGGEDYDQIDLYLKVILDNESKTFLKHLFSKQRSTGSGS